MEYFISEYDLENILVGLPNFLKIKSKIAYPFVLNKLEENLTSLISKIQNFGIFKSVYLCDLEVENSDFDFFDERIKFISETYNIEIYEKITQIEKIFEHKNYLKNLKFIFPVVNKFNVLSKLNTNSCVERSEEKIKDEKNLVQIKSNDLMDVVDSKDYERTDLNLMDIVVDNKHVYNNYEVNNKNKSAKLRMKIFEKNNNLFSCLNFSTGISHNNSQILNNLIDNKIDKDGKEEKRVSDTKSIMVDELSEKSINKGDSYFKMTENFSFENDSKKIVNNSQKIINKANFF